VELGDEPAQLRILADATEAQLQKFQEEKEKATEALKQEKEEVLEKLRVARYHVTAYENEKEEFQAMIQEEKSQLQREKEKLLAGRATVKEVVNKSCHSISGIAQEEQESVEV
jgi:predicted  nucleic acid-binding Zn-ribbon protein